jgi:hypothetical protein
VIPLLHPTVCLIRDRYPDGVPLWVVSVLFLKFLADDMVVCCVVVSIPISNCESPSSRAVELWRIVCAEFDVDR